MKIFTLAPRENWICDRIAEEWNSVSCHLSENPHDADIIWLLAGWCWNHIPTNILELKKVVVTVHHIVPEKFSREKIKDFIIRDQFVDAYHVPNHKTKEFISSLTYKPIFVLGYWYDEKKWHHASRAECRNLLNLPEDSFVVGSFQRDTEGHDLISPKLEKGPDRLCDYLKKIKTENTHVLLGGFRRQYVINRLEEEGITYSYFELATMDTLRIMYGACDLYVIASRNEGGPQAVLEACAMKIPTISTNVGMVSEVLSEKSIIDIENEVYHPAEEDIEYAYERVRQFEIQLHHQKYLEMFKEVILN
jgi:glycosyltransferase involved in cell wall biosynthesis